MSEYLGVYMSRSEVLNDEQEQGGGPGLYGWYESGLPSAERKKRGHYSTPLPLVEQILDACGYTSDADLTRIRVLDPACGSGNFLAGAARRLLASSRRLGLSQSEQARLLTRNIWGFDPDPVSCFLTRMQLSSRVGGVRFIASSSLNDREPAGRDSSRPYDRDWHIHQADSLALPWEPCVDLFLANPPYLAAKNADLSGYRSALQRGQADSYLLFLSLAMQVVRPGGWIGLVLPDPVLARLNAARERAQLLRQMTLHHLWHLSDVFAAEVGAVVLVAQNVPPTPAHQVAWVRSRWQSCAALSSNRPGQIFSTLHTPGSIPAMRPLEAREAPQALLLRQPAAELRYLLSSENGVLLDQLRVALENEANGERKLAPLGEFVTISRGEELGRESPFIRRDMELPAGGDAYIALGTRATTPGQGDASVPSPPIIHTRPYRGLPLLRGGIDIRPFASPRAAWRIDHEAVTKPMQRYLAPKLLVVKSTDRLQATLDTRGHVSLQTLYLLQIRERGEQHGQQMPEERVDLLYFFLALLNSRLLRDYVYILHTAYKWVQPQIEQRVLASLPVPLVEGEEQAEIVQQAKRLERACSKAGAVVEWDEETSALYEALERTIRAIYMSAMHSTY